MEVNNKKQRDAIRKVLTLVEANLYRLERVGHGKIEIVVSRRNARSVSFTVMAARMIRFDAPTADEAANKDFEALSERVEIEETEDDV